MKTRIKLTPMEGEPRWLAPGEFAAVTVTDEGQPIQILQVGAKHVCVAALRNRQVKVDLIGHLGDDLLHFVPWGGAA